MLLLLLQGGRGGGREEFKEGRGGRDTGTLIHMHTPTHPHTHIHNIHTHTHTHHHGLTQCKDMVQKAFATGLDKMADNEDQDSRRPTGKQVLQIHRCLKPVFTTHSSLWTGACGLLSSHYCTGNSAEACTFILFVTFPYWWIWHCICIFRVGIHYLHQYIRISAVWGWEGWGGSSEVYTD